MPNIEKSNLNIIIPGLGCCSGEILTSRGPVYDIQRFGINFVRIPEDADIMVVSGFMGKAIIQNLIDTYNLMRPPRWVFVVGSCAIDGGRFCGVPGLLKEIKNQLHIDMYVPGCPPRPEAFMHAVLKFLLDNIESSSVKVKND